MFSVKKVHRLIIMLGYHINEENVSTVIRV